MNDFAKEELEQLLSWADVYTELGRSWTTKLQMPLINKIQTMIDNYFEITTPTMASYCCNKCNEEWIKCECKK